MLPKVPQGTTKLRPRASGRLDGGESEAQNERSGDNLRVVEVIAPFGGAEEMVKDLREKVFPTRPVNFLAVTKDGKQVRVL